MAYTYTRTGQADTVADYTGTRGFVYNGTDPLQLDAVDLPGFYGSRVLTRQYDGIHRSAGFLLGTAGNLSGDLNQVYTYNNLGRFDHVDSVSSAQASRTFAYGYNSGGLVSSLGIPGSAFAVSYGYEANRDLLTSIDSQWSGASRTRYDYHYNNLAQRDTGKQSGDVFADFGDVTKHSYVYNPRGELIDAADYLGTDTNNSANQLSGRHHALTYDNLGNRLTASRTGTPAPGGSDFRDHYSPNAVNQYSTRENNYAHTAGTVADSVGVSVTGGTGTSGVGRQGRYWDAQVTLNNTTGPASAPLTITGTLPNGAGAGIDLYYSDSSRKAYLAAALQTFSYDDDGNMLTDGIWKYTYDAENRLITMFTTDVAVSGGFPNRTLEFKYDYLGRRVQKRSLNATAGTDVYRRYLYDGDNLVAEFDVNSPTNSPTCGSLLKSYTWGLDMAGSLTATGGVGALVQITDHATSTSYFPTYDGNGNVASLLQAADGAGRLAGSVVAKYEYSPFGELLRSEGAYAQSNPFRFSTKFTDDESGLVYYGARYYSPSLGRFIDRDPIEEAGGLNLYGFCGNDGVNGYDYLGNSWFSSALKRLGNWISGHIPTVVAVVAAIVTVAILGPENPEAWTTAGKVYGAVYGRAKAVDTISNGLSGRSGKSSGLVGSRSPLVNYFRPEGAMMGIAETGTLGITAGAGLLVLGGGAMIIDVVTGAMTADGTFRRSVQGPGGSLIPRAQSTTSDLPENLKPQHGFIIHEGADPELVGDFLRARATDPDRARRILIEISNRTSSGKYGANPEKPRVYKAAVSSTALANKAAGKAAEVFAKADLEAQGYTVLGSNVTARTSQGIRFIDHLVDVNGDLFAVEVKSGGAFRSSGQLLKDTAMEFEGATLSGPNVPAFLQGQVFKIPTVEMHY